MVFYPTPTPKWGRSIIRDFPNRTANAAIRAALIVSVGETGNSRTLTASAGGRCHCFTHCGSSPSAHPIFAENCGKHTNASIFPWSVPFTVPGAPGASCARRGVPGRPRAPLGLSRIYSVPQAINGSRGFARCEGVSQIRVGRVKIKRMSLNCPPYSFHRQSDCKSERQPYPPLLCVHFRGPPGHHRRVLRVDTRKALHLYGLGC